MGFHKPQTYKNVANPLIKGGKIWNEKPQFSKSNAFYFLVLMVPTLSNIM